MLPIFICNVVQCALLHSWKIEWNRSCLRRQRKGVNATLVVRRRIASLQVYSPKIELSRCDRMLDSISDIPNFSQFLPTLTNKNKYESLFFVSMQCAWRFSNLSYSWGSSPVGTRRHDAYRHFLLDFTPGDFKTAVPIDHPRMPLCSSLWFRCIASRSLHELTKLTVADPIGLLPRIHSSIAR